MFSGVIKLRNFSRFIAYPDFFYGKAVTLLEFDIEVSSELVVMDTVILNLIAASLSDYVFFEMIHCHPAAEAWSTLKEWYSSTSDLKIMHLKNGLHSIQKGTDSIEVY